MLRQRGEMEDGRRDSDRHNSEDEVEEEMKDDSDEREEGR